MKLRRRGILLEGACKNEAQVNDSILNWNEKINVWIGKKSIYIFLYLRDVMRLADIPKPCRRRPKTEIIVLSGMNGKGVGPWGNSILHANI